ncbi:hypothetical protein OFM35_32550, partial [Escherichia coli]|nr:hypothetical protein [Escherichia coli]
TVPEDLKSADIEITAEVEGKADNVRFDISLDGTQVASETVQVSSGKATASFTLENPSLWYPIRYGKQPLYQVKATLISDDSEEDEVE